MASDHYTPNGGKNSSGQGWQYNNQSGGQPPKKGGFNLGEWVPIIVLFCIPSGFTQIIALIWAIKKAFDMTTRQQRRHYYNKAKTTATNVTRDVADAVRREVNNAKQTGGAQKAGSTAQPGASSGGKQTTTTTSGGAKVTYNSAAAKATAKKARQPKSGTGLIVGGSILTGVFGLGTVALLSTFLESLAYGYFFSSELSGVVSCMAFLCGGLAMLFKGIGNNRRRERFLNYLAYIGANREVDLAHMAASFDVPVRKLCKDLRKMLSDGILPTGYLDLAAGKLFLTEMGYRAPEPEVRQEKAAEEIKKDEDAILREIRQINDDIPDEVMSAKIDRIEEITAKILSYQKTHPERGSQLRSFLNYYLPTTLKILRAYAQLDAQGIEGENISAAKARIEGMMDQVVAGFEKQLDKLFQDQAMDISSDVQVLENMLKKDGLSDDSQNMTMTL